LCRGLNEERPNGRAFARRASDGRGFCSRIQDSPTKADVHARSLELIGSRRDFLPQKDSRVRKILDGNGLVFGVDRHPRRLFQTTGSAREPTRVDAVENDTMLTQQPDLDRRSQKIRAAGIRPGSASTA